MKRAFYILAAMAMAVILSNCGAPKENSPKQIADKALTYMEKGDYDGFTSLVHFSEIPDGSTEKEMRSELAQMLDEKVSKDSSGKYPIVSHEILSEELSDDGQEATVEYKAVYKNGIEETEDFKLIKDPNGNWWIYAGK